MSLYDYFKETNWYVLDSYFSLFNISTQHKVIHIYISKHVSFVKIAHITVPNGHITDLDTKRKYDIESGHVQQFCYNFSYTFFKHDT